METDPYRWIQALRASHDALVTQVLALSPEQLSDESYCKGWTLGQVLSHIGSGAEIGLTNLERALGGAAPLGGDDFQVIWGRWNALSQADKASEMVIWDRRNVSVIQGLDEQTLSTLRMPFFTGTEIDVATLAGFRLSEHAVHSWDVAVTLDPQAEILESSVALLIDRLGFIVWRLAKAAEASGPRRIEIRTTDPERRFLLTLDDKASWAEGEAAEADDAAVDASLALPAAALIRLLYGRLDPDHTPAEVKTEGEADLDELRRVFPGF
jgi:uncharacterized protein (TIGR03083 family)